MNRFMKLAIDEAVKGVQTGDGGPFGAVIVLSDEIVGAGHNTVLRTNDPTAHAEINAIRMATSKLQRFDLSDCVIYSSCEPCPMCFAAIHWAKIETLYYGCTKEDAEGIGFDDKQIYDAIKGKTSQVKLTMQPLNREQCLAPFRLWASREDKVRY